MDRSAIDKCRHSRRSNASVPTWFVSVRLSDNWRPLCDFFSVCCRCVRLLSLREGEKEREREKKKERKVAGSVPIPIPIRDATSNGLHWLSQLGCDANRKEVDIKRRAPRFLLLTLLTGAVTLTLALEFVSLASRPTDRPTSSWLFLFPFPLGALMLLRNGDSLLFIRFHVILGFFFDFLALIHLTLRCAVLCCVTRRGRKNAICLHLHFAVDFILSLIFLFFLFFLFGDVDLCQCLCHWLVYFYIDLWTRLRFLRLRDIPSAIFLHSTTACRCCRLIYLRGLKSAT